MKEIRTSHESPSGSTLDADEALDSVILWRNRNNKDFSAIAGPELLDQELYLTAPFRIGHQYPKRRNYTGEHWFSNTGTHVWYESLFERQSMLWLDFTCDIVAIATQPMRMNFANGRHHFPDIIALHADSRQVVYDVRPASLITAKTQAQFDETAKVCRQVGWDYEIISSFGSMAQGNLSWLSNFRQTHYAPPAEARSRLLAALGSPLPLSVAAASMAADRPTASAGWLYHLAWVGEVALDLSAPISNATLVRKASSCEL